MAENERGTQASVTCEKCGRRYPAMAFTINGQCECGEWFPGCKPTKGEDSGGSPYRQYYSMTQIQAALDKAGIHLVATRRKILEALKEIRC